MDQATIEIRNILEHVSTMHRVDTDDLGVTPERREEKANTAGYNEGITAVQTYLEEYLEEMRE